MSFLSNFFGGGDQEKSNTITSFTYSGIPTTYSGGVTTVKSTSSDGVITIDMLAKNAAVVSQNQALKVETFYNCVRDKSETIGAIPLKLHKVDRDGKRTLVEAGRMHRIFTQRPNDYMTWQGFNEMCVASLETIGAFYAYKVYNGRGNIAELIPFANQRSVTANMDIAGRVYYTYVTNDGSIVVAQASELMIISMFTLNGYTPVSPLMYQADLLGLAKAQEDNYHELQKSGITSQMALGTDNVFKDNNAIARLKEDWGNARGKNGFKTIPILENGLKPVNLNLTPQEMDLLSQREFTVDRIHGMTRVPKYRVNGSEKAGDKIFELDEAYLRNNLNPVMMKLEHAVNEVLNGEYRITFDRNAFYAGSPWRLVESIDKAVRGGLKMVNEGRRDMGMEPVEGGDVFVIQSNNAIYGTWTELPTVRDQLNNVGSKPTEKPTENNDENAN